MKKIQVKQIRAALFLLALFLVCLAAGFFKGALFIPAAACLAGYLWIDKKYLRCPHCAGFLPLERLLCAKTKEYHCASCGKRIEVEE